MRLQYVNHAQPLVHASHKSNTAFRSAVASTRNPTDSLQTASLFIFKNWKHTEQVHMPQNTGYFFTADIGNADEDSQVLPVPSPSSLQDGSLVHPSRALHFPTGYTPRQ
jgi:hypothetical protein